MVQNDRLHKVDKVFVRQASSCNCENIQYDKFKLIKFPPREQLCETYVG